MTQTLAFKTLRGRRNREAQQAPGLWQTNMYGFAFGSAVQAGLEKISFGVPVLYLSVINANWAILWHLFWQIRPECVI